MTFNYRMAFDLVNPALIDWDFYQPYTKKEPPFSQIGLAVYLRTYSRYIPQLKRREKWCETVLRVVEYSLSLDKVTPAEDKKKEALELFDAIFNLRLFPAGRTLWIGGTEAVKRTPSANFNCSFSCIDSLSSIVEGFYLLLVGAGFGFSIEEKYTDDLPSARRDVTVKHEKNIEWDSGYPDTEIYFPTTCTSLFLPATDLALSDHEFNYKIEAELVSPCEPITIFVGDSKEGWCTALKTLLWVYCDSLISDVTINYNCVRPKGTPLKTFGGRASGHEALQEFFERIESIIREGKDSRLSSTQILDICNAMGAAVVVGGVRRSSEIALGDMDDIDFINAKRNLWSDDSLADKRHYRTMSNNSVVLNENPGLDWFKEVMESVKTNGEPGFVSIGNMNQRLMERCKKYGLNYVPRKGTNPCLSANTWIHTEYGARQIKDLIGQQVGVYVDGSLFSTDDRGFYKTGHKTVYKLTTKEGMLLEVTDNHPVLAVTARTRKKVYSEWKEVKDLRIGQEIALHDHRQISQWTGDGSMEDGYLIGSLMGDGTISDNNAILRYWDKDEGSKDCLDFAYSCVESKLPHRRQAPATTYHKGNQYHQVQSRSLYNLCSRYGIVNTKTKIVTDEIEKASFDFYLGFLAGFFDTDGSPQGSQGKGVSLRLSQTNRDNLVRVQRMLLRIGINSTIYARKNEHQSLLPDGKGGKVYYDCQPSWELVISKDNLFQFAQLIPLKNARKSERLNSLLSQYQRRPNRETFVATIESIEPIGEFDVYDCTVPSVHRFDANGIVVHNCAEIELDSKGVCNLSEVNVAAHIVYDNCIPELDIDALTDSVRLATRIGSRMTLVDMFHPEWDKVQKRDRLLGVSLTGIMTASDILDGGLDKESMFKMLQCVVNIESFNYHDNLGIPHPLLATCIKPSGTLSLLPGVSPGIHRDYAPYYLRRVRVSKTDPVAHALRSLNIPCSPENGQGNDLDADICKTWVFTFPIKTEAPIRSIDEPAIEQLERYRTSMKHWTQHNSSVTISVDENEWDGVANWLYENYDDFVGVSFLPKFDSHNSPYPQLPMESCDKGKYEELAAKMPRLSEEQFIELIASKELFYEDYELDSGCSTGACPIR